MRLFSTTKEKLNQGDLARLKKLLKKQFFLQHNSRPDSQARFHISMDNDYFSPKGEVFKKQHLRAEYQRVIKPLSGRLAALEFTWGKVCFTSKDKQTVCESMDWTFAQGLKFNHYKIFPQAVFRAPGEDENYAIDFSDTGIHYDSLMSTPSVNLLYMLTWDVIGFEEMNSHIGTTLDKFNQIGNVAEIQTVTGTCAQLDFRNCSENSFFKNGRFEAKFLGIGNVSCRPAAIFDYRCTGELSVVANSEGRVKEQTGSSYYFGKIFVDLEDGDILSGDMIEIITAVLINDKGKWLPQQKRRLVRMVKSSEGSRDE
ncbi:MAG: hypothetical protein QME41_08835 [Actinomycetota bacterium]|nr:hypothetical protein [Actinomycetota bacterium]